MTCVLLLLLLSACGPQEDTRETVRIAMPASDAVTDAETNYYKLWLEEQTGQRIEIELIAADFVAEYLRQFLSSGSDDVDAIFFSGEVDDRVIGEYGAAGLLLPLEGYIQEGTFSKAAFDGFTEYDMEAVLQSGDGHTWFLPNLTYSDIEHYSQSLWLNTDWLADTGLPLPQTLSDFETVLRSFGEKAKSDGGTAAAGCTDSESMNLCHYLMNAFIYTDPLNAYLTVSDGEIFFAPTNDAWREGVMYCANLYREGLLPQNLFTFNPRQVVSLVNDPRDLTGCFTARDIADIISENSSVLLAKYRPIPPLMGPDGVRVAVVTLTAPALGAVVPATCKKPEAAFRLMDIMLSEEAYLVAAFGERGVDWDSPGVGDVSRSGTAATITIKEQEWNLPHNKNFGGTGPFLTYPEYGDGVAWSGYQSDQRYLNARAARFNHDYEPVEYLGLLLLDAEAQTRADAIRAHVSGRLTDFITGILDPEDDTHWNAVLNEYDELGLAMLMEDAEASYAKMKGGAAQ